MTNEPELNTLNINGFVFEIQRMPSIKYMCQTVDFPGISLPEVLVPTPFIDLPVPGEHLTYDDLTFSFMVDEKMRNYLALRHWMVALAFPEKYEQFKNFVKGVKENDDIEFFFGNERLNQYSDVTVTVLSNQKNAQFVYRFTDAHPTLLSGFPLSVTETTSTPIVANVTMKFSSMTVEPA